MQKSPTITVIVSVFNNQETIVDALQSILDTSYNDLDIIIFDDGSTDSSLEKAYDFKSQNQNAKIQIFTHSNHENKGVSFTRNQAIKQTNSTYASFLDADDIYFSNRFDAIIKLLENDLTIDAAFGVFERYQEPSIESPTPFLKSVYPNQNFLKNQFSDLEVGEPISLIDFLSGQSGIHISTLTFRTSSLQKLGGFPNLKFSEDHALFARAISTQKIVRATHQPVSIYRINHQSSCSRGRGTLEFNYSNILAYFDTINWLKKIHASDEAIKILKERIAGKLFTSYSKPFQSSSFSFSDNQKIINIFLKSGLINPKLFLNLNFHKILLKRIIFALLKFD